MSPASGPVQTHHEACAHPAGPLDWPDATVEDSDAGDVVARLREESDVPLRSHGSVLVLVYRPTLHG